MGNFQHGNTADIAYLRECLHYEPETGDFYWKLRPRHHFPNENIWKTINTRNGGTKAGSISNNGYVTIRLTGKLHLAHRLAWMFMWGTPIPPGREIDHINRNKADNRFKNLRLATRGQNGFNSKRKRNTKLPKNVCFDRGKNKYVVWVRAYGKQHFIGRFETIEEASVAATEAREKLHGRFCYHDT